MVTERMETMRNVVYDLCQVHNMHFAYNPKLGLYRYDNGIYKEDYDSAWLTHFIRNLHPTMESKTIEDIVKIIKQENFKDISEFDSEQNKHIVALNNYNYNLTTNETEEFTPDIINTTRIAVTYNPKAKCPIIDRYFQQTIALDDIPNVEELFGFLLSKGYEHKYIFILFGGIDGGKGTLLQLITQFVSGNVSNVPPHTIASDKFAAAELYGKLANISGDISGKLIEDTSMLKMLIGSDGIQANKKFGVMFTFKNIAKLIFGCNTLPTLPDNEMDIFVQKTILIKFPHTFPKEQQDHFLLWKMTTEQELSGLLNKALEGRKRLRKNGDFSKKMTREQIRELYFEAGNPVVKFVHDMIDISVTDVTPKDDILILFKDYCDLHTLSYPKAVIAFWRTFKTSLPKEHIDYNRRIGSHGNQKYAIGGIRLRTLDEVKEEQEQQKTKYEIPIIDESKFTGKPITTEYIPENPMDYEPEIPEPDMPHPFPEPDPELQTKEEVDRVNALVAQKRKEEEEEENALGV